LSFFKKNNNQVNPGRMASKKYKKILLKELSIN